ncbi:MAG: hypothetical protein WCS96_10205 [Victivallales bacterium]
MKVPPKVFKFKTPAMSQTKAEIPPASPQPVPPPPAIPLQKPQMSPPQRPMAQAATQQGIIRQGRLIQSGSSVASPVPPPPPVMTLRPESIKKPEVSSIAKPALDKTFVRMCDVPEKYQIPDMSEDLQKIIENEAENYKDQVQSFVDLCEIFSNPGWQFPDIVDYIHMLVRSVNLDVLSIVLTDSTEKGRLCKAISRGYKSAPGSRIVAEWASAVTADATVNWDRLMDIAADKNTKISRWISGEALHSVGYVPIHDSKRIYGFLLVGAYENKIQSPLASSLLELCGNRIGLVLETRRGASAPSEKITQTASLVQDHLAMLTSYLEVLKISARINPEDVANTAEKCLKTIAEIKKMLQ